MNYPSDCLLVHFSFCLLHLYSIVQSARAYYTCLHVFLLFFKGMPKAAVNFLSIVAENGRLKLLRRMVNMFLAVMVAHRNEALCEVITAKPLDDSTRSALMDALKKFVKDGKKIQLTEKVDPSIIGGMIVGVEDKHIDMSIARKIQMYTDILKQAL